ncbi:MULTISPECIES: helix-turn-helix domain-containing protein [Cupriavidus]|jgi:transcriptional regulator with XRE-family HTH domain|uniref:XRE family transcriptional regulator n=1 Tax=Cupriavidus metallidurans TaxID=119219 RepID=A0A482J1V2_9BURK|nr:MULTISPECIES: helix-turn-helix transcriptional regulator [Cupriavidus]KWR82375.1 DNA-binding protein [Cupriavidus sp. SHE]QBP13529.1 XRE family transcriptional regulator [Cupriavidus metallidurans]QWC91310.1 helix-turn-helix transcriptional regulator [Cupriavidus metallidurans]
MKTIHDDRYQAIVRKLIELRKSTGTTQQSMADALGRPQSFVSKVESLERRLDVVELHDWLQALGVDAGSFLREFTWW